MTHPFPTRRSSALLILGMTAEEIRTKGQVYRFGTPVHYDPMPTLRAVDVPQLWALGGQDIDAPAGETARRIKGLIAEGRPITLAVFPKAEHGMTEFRSEEHTLNSSH